MSTANKNPFTSFVNAYCGLVANQVSDMSTQFDKVVSQSNALFNELALRGEAVEAELKKSIPENMKMNKSIKNWFDAFSFGSAKREKQIDELSKKVDGLIDVVAVLAEQQTKQAKPAAATTAAKPKTTRAAAKPTAKPATTSKAATKPAAKKPAAKRTPAKKPATSKATTAKAPVAATPKPTDSE